jgi:tRNA(Ile)-lysidine synthase
MFSPMHESDTNHSLPFAEPLLQSLHEALQDLKSQQIIPTGIPAATVGYSTGADSTALLHAASRLRDADLLQLRALHVNHGLHPDCLRWQEMAELLCRQLQVPLSVVCVEVDLHATSVESAAREARYRAFGEHVHKDEVLLLAHHERDLAETLLLHLLRGSGAVGLSGMPRSRSLGKTGAHLLRPWLHIEAAQLKQYCRHHELSYSEDSSNLDPQHDRGWLRTEVLPMLERRKPGAVANIALSARLQEHNRNLATLQLDQLLQSMLEAADSSTAHRSLDINALLQLSDTWLQHDLLRHWLQSLHLQPPSRRQLQTLLEQLSAAGSDKHPALHQSAYSLARYQGRLHVYARPERSIQPAQWQLPQPWHDPRLGTLRIDTKHAIEHGDAAVPDNAITAWPILTVTKRAGGERILLQGGCHHKLKKLLQQADIPRWQRSRLPLLWHRHRLVAVADLFVHPALQRWLRQHELQLKWTPAHTMFADLSGAGSSTDPNA